MKKKHVLRYLVGLFVLVLAMVPLSACSAPDDTPRQRNDLRTTDEVADWVDEPADWVEDAADDVGDWYWDDAPESEPEHWEGTVRDDASAAIEYGESIGELPILLPSETGRQLVYNVDMHFQTTEFMAGTRAMLNKIVDLDGYSEEVIVHGRPILRPYIKRSASGTFRIPTIHLNEFIIFMEENYNLLFLSQRMVDHTISYEGDQAQLDRLREQEQRLLANMEDEEEDIDAIREDLDALQDSIRNLEAATASLERNVIYSTVVVILEEEIIPEEEEEIEEEEEEEIVPPTFGERFLDTMESSLSGLLVVSQAVFLVIFAILPWILPPTILTLLIILAIRRSHRKRKLRAANAPPHPFDPNPPAQR